MNIPLAKNGIKCEWMLELINAKTGKVDRRLPWQKNTILDSGLAYLCSTATGQKGLFTSPNSSRYSAKYAYIAVGTGTTTPAYSDTGLNSWLACKAITPALCAYVVQDVNNNTAPIAFTQIADFSESEANGVITEMGLCDGTSSSAAFFCRNLLVDADGLPTSIVKDSSHLMRITAKITVTRVGDPFASIPITELGGLGTANNVVSFVNNQWLMCSLMDTHTTGQGLYYNGGITAYAASQAVSLASGIANLSSNSVTAIAGYVYGVLLVSKPNAGKIGDDYYVDMKLEFGQTICNTSIKCLFISSFMRADAEMMPTGTGGNSGCFCQFETPLPKDSTKKLYLTFRHTWTRS